MSYPGLTFALMVGVAIGTAIYCFFKSETPNAHHYDHQYQPPPTSPGYDTNPQKKRRRNSNSNNHQICSICYDKLFAAVRPIRKLRCDHIFHVDCITQWINCSPSSTCPNCRMQL